jgi:hypothetical protein
MAANSFAPMPAPAPVTSVAEAERLATHLIEVMDALLEVLQQETQLVRAGKLAKAALLEQPKSDLTRLYISDTLRLRASRVHLAALVPDTLAMLHQRHDTFRALLQVNLTVLATAHAVSEGIVRGVSDELARKTRPQTYGASGVANAPVRKSAPPLSVSRSL